MRLIALNYTQKIYLLATLPLIFAVTAISLVVAYQAREVASREVAQLETQLLEAKKLELRNYLTIARNGFFPIYGRAQPDDQDAKDRVIQMLVAMTWGKDGFFFVFDYDGVNLVSPRQTALINRDLTGLTDSEGTEITDRLIEIARSGAGYHTYMWEKPSTGEEARMITYVAGLQSWRWAVGTGLFIDDVLETVAAARAETEARIASTFRWIGIITVGALALVGASGLFLNLREARLADAKLRALTQRIVDTQEEERGRVARELHDSISQILVGVRYALELARKKLLKGEPSAADNLERGIDGLSGAIQEVRRISRDLRPGMLDDLGLGPALQALTEDFGARTGISTAFETVVFRGRLDGEARIALYRVAQEALTNIERHSGASSMSMRVWGHARGATLRIADDGIGIEAGRKSRGKDPANPAGGLGLRNMQERIDQLGGTLRLMSSRSGTVIEAEIPLSHMLPPESGTTEPTRHSA
ncbi:MAG: cache domain-containing protein [Oceanicola sp.]|jgi:two-component system NarL family sensor kinase|nr:cache domain-containing protein [Oceanicola sp.]